MATINLKLKTYDELIFEITRLNTEKYLLEQKLEQKENIIKEVREYIEDNNFLDWTLGINTELGELKLRQKELLEILDKEKE